MKKTAGTETRAARVNPFTSFIKFMWAEHSIVFVFIIIFSTCSFLAPRFATINNIMAISRNSSIVGMIALGMTFVIITGGIDLSCGHQIGRAHV